jgi:CrcB protein
LSGPDPRALCAVALGGAGGAVARWGLGELTRDGDGFPWTTFAINVSGSLLLAVVLALPVVRRRPVLLAGLGPGVLGGYTTLSTWSEQTRVLLADGQVATASAYVVATVSACLAAVALGSRIGSRS